MTDATSAKAQPARPIAPSTVRFALVAMGVQIVLTVVGTILLWGYTPQLTRQLITNNSKAKTPKNPYGAVQAAHDLHSGRVVQSWQSAVVCLLIIGAGVMIWTGRGLARWLYLLLVLLFSIGGIGALGSGGPQTLSTLSFIVAACSVGAVVLLVLPESSRYFAQAKAIRYPNAPVRGRAGATAGRGAARPGGLRGLLMSPPRLPVDDEAPTVAAKPVPASRPADTRPASRAAGAAAAETGDGTGRGKPKARTGAETPGGGASASSESGAASRGRGKSRRV